MNTIIGKLKSLSRDKNSNISHHVWATTKYLSDLFANHDDEFLGAIALAAYELEQGHTCVHLPSLMNPVVWSLHALHGVIPSTDKLINYVEAKTPEWLANNFVAPVRIKRNHLYLDRQYQNEQYLAQWVADRVKHGLVEGLDLGKVVKVAEKYFSINRAEAIDWQQTAAVMALTHRFCVITGGPGTGKTTTVTRLMAMAIEEWAAFGFTKAPKIVLAAPTGKAKNRMAESISGQIALVDGDFALPMDANMKSLIPVETKTIHRLLGVNPTIEEPRYNEHNKLDCDICIIDEGSMVDLERIVSLVKALPLNARLIILADKDQLASVDAGAIIAELCSSIVDTDSGKSIGVSGQTRSILERVAGGPIENFIKNDTIEIANHIICLQKSHRFNDGTGIGKLAKAIKEGNAKVALSALIENDDLEWHDTLGAQSIDDMVHRLVGTYATYLDLIARTQCPLECFAQLKKQVVLSSLRRGMTGAMNLNRRIANIASSVEPDWYKGMPIIIAENAYQVKLFNGDIGIVLEDANGELKACFEDGEGGYRYISKHRLPTWDLAYVLTIHKSQGSEWHHVSMVLNGNSPVETKELIYTGLTRTMRTFELFSGENTFSKSIRKRSDRHSGLFVETLKKCRK
jgi:exodeoxyribonuclease V alpha subunit